DADLFKGVSDDFEFTAGGPEAVVGRSIQPAVFDHQVTVRVLGPDGIALGAGTHRGRQRREAAHVLHPGPLQDDAPAAGATLDAAPVALEGGVCRRVLRVLGGIRAEVGVLDGDQYGLRLGAQAQQGPVDDQPGGVVLGPYGRGAGAGSDDVYGNPALD